MRGSAEKASPLDRCVAPDDLLSNLPYCIIGLSMRLDETRPGGTQYFTFEHNGQYQKIQWLFLDAVESLQPEAIMVSKTC